MELENIKAILKGILVSARNPITMEQLKIGKIDIQLIINYCSGKLILDNLSSFQTTKKLLLKALKKNCFNLAMVVNEDGMTHKYGTILGKIDYFSVLNNLSTLQRW